MYLPFNINILANIFLVIIALWTIPWKIYAVWLAVKHNQKKWFVMLLILNTFSILEIYYVLKIANRNWAEIEQDFRNAWRDTMGEKKTQAQIEDHHDHGHH